MNGVRIILLGCNMFFLALAIMKAAKDKGEEEKAKSEKISMMCTTSEFPSGCAGIPILTLASSTATTNLVAHERLTKFMLRDWTQTAMRDGWKVDYSGEDGLDEKVIWGTLEKVTEAFSDLKL